MVKFKITPERFAEACSILQYLSVISKNEGVVISVAPRFIVDDKDEYIVKVNLDEDGDIESLENMDKALEKLSLVTPKRLEKLVQEFSEAANSIVNGNPTKGDSPKEKD